MADKDKDMPVVAAPDPDEVKKVTEIVEGGKYIVGDRYVDAHGKDLGAAPKKK